MLQPFSMKYRQNQPMYFENSWLRFFMTQDSKWNRANFLRVDPSSHVIFLVCLLGVEEYYTDYLLTSNLT